MTTLAPLLGGIGLFILGMRMMTEGLKLAAGNALSSILNAWTKSALRGFAAGLLITGIVQSSSAVTVATVGFVNAGLLTLTQAVWVIFGTNVGTTMTGWLVALVGVKVEVGSLALPMLGVGMLLRIAFASNVQRAGFAEALAGFGAFFLGIAVLQEGFTELAPRVASLSLLDGGWKAASLFVLAGMLLTLFTQSSSASIAITLTASSGASIPLELAASAVIGTNIGTTSTALFASIGATPPAKRVATAHIVFNLLTGAVALMVLPTLLAASRALVDSLPLSHDTPATLAVFHTLFNILGVTLIWPFTRRLVRFLSNRFKSLEEEIGRPRYLDATLAEVPALALRGLVLELCRMMDLAFAIARRRNSEPIRHMELASEAAGLLRLGRDIRDFISRISASTLPGNVVEALPDLVRTVQHLEDVGSHPARTPHAPARAVTDLAGDHWRNLQTAVTASFQRDQRSIDERLPLEKIDALHNDVETAYQGVKTDLLRATARGLLHVDRMEDALLYARQLRRRSDSALKAQRRLLPWVERAAEKS